MPKAIHPYDVLRRPIITEKSTALAAFGKYVFEVDTRANKPQIRDAVQRVFAVTVTSVNTSMVRGKTRRTGRRVGQQSSWKKAIVTLVPGDEIELFEGV